MKKINPKFEDKTHQNCGDLMSRNHYCRLAVIL